MPFNSSNFDSIIIKVGNNNARNLDAMLVTSLCILTSFNRSVAIYVDESGKMSVEQRFVIRFCVLSGLSQRETIEKLEVAYGEQAMKKTAVYKWFARFKDGECSADDKQRCGRPSTITSDDVMRIKELLDRDRRITIREIEERVDCSMGTIHTIIHEELGMRRICARWIPKMLSEDQKAERVRCCEKFLIRFEREGDYFLDRIVTVDETWISLYQPETKSQSTMWKTPGSPSPQKFKVTTSTRKQMFVIFYDVDGVVLSHAVPHGQTVTAEYYSKVLKRDFMRAMRKKRSEKLENLIFHHDNAPAHRSARTQTALHQLAFGMLEHPPYSPDLAPCDFFLFPTLKNSLRGEHFDDVCQLSHAVQNAIAAIPQKAYRQSYLSWVSRCRKCVAHRGEYFEKM